MAYLGITPPVSFAHPSPADIAINDKLTKYLHSNDIYESDEGQLAREEVISVLHDLVRHWISQVGLSRGALNEKTKNIGGGLVRVFGSQKLGVHTPEADIDILCIAPMYISRYDFFSSFCDILKQRDDVTLLLPLPEAYTPVLKFNISGQQIDMIFVSLALQSIPDRLDVLDDNYLSKLDEQSVRSLNGCRVAERLLQLVPNFDSFCTALRAIKHWARRRGIYANVLGFLGGVNFAILVAFVCQIYVNACPATLVMKFFKLYSQWEWPRPIMLTAVEDVEVDGTHLPSWNPKFNPTDRMHIMPIITPAAPCMNSAYNVGGPQFRMLQREIRRGHQICEEWLNESDSSASSWGQRDKGGSFPWAELMTASGPEFFKEYPRYIQIDVSAVSADAHRLWFGWCESRLRQLLVSLDQPDMVFCHPHANCYHREVSSTTPPAPNVPLTSSSSDGSTRGSNICGSSSSNSSGNSSGGNDGTTHFSSSFFVGLSFRNGTRSIDLTPTIQNFVYRVCAWYCRTVEMDLNIKGLSREELPSFVFESASLPSSSTHCTPAKSKAVHPPLTSGRSPIASGLPVEQLQQLDDEDVEDVEGDQSKALHDTCDDIITPHVEGRDDNDEMSRGGICDISTVSMSGDGISLSGGNDSSIMMESPLLLSPPDEDDRRGDYIDRISRGGKNDSRVQVKGGHRRNGSNDVAPTTRGSGGKVWKKISFTGITSQQEDVQSEDGEVGGQLSVHVGHGGDEEVRQPISSPLKRSRPY